MTSDVAVDHPAADAFAHLHPFYGARVGGQDVQELSAASVSLVDPRTGAEFARAIDGGADEVDLAVSAARDAFPAWSAMTALDRGRTLQEVARAVRRDGERLALLECLNTGRRIQECRGDVEATARYFEFYGGLAAGLEGSVFEPTRTDVFTYQVREPYGVTGHIVPWNVPMSLTARGVAPALATGNTVVVKPSVETPVTTLELERLTREAGVPAGTVNVVPGGAGTGAALAGHPGVPRLSFTGSVATGRKVLASALPRMCHVTLELGGKSPHIVFADADLDRALDAAVRAILSVSGQACVAGSRLLVEDAVHDELVSRLAGRFREIAGDEDGLSPLISARQRDRVLGYVDGAVEQGARAVVNAARDRRGGFYVGPTLFADVTPEMTLFQEEVFGPVLAVTRFMTEEQAVALANDTTYGLAAGLWTNSVSRVMRMVPRLQAGSVYVNDYLNTGVEAPGGGYKLSGLGYEKGRMAMDEYSQWKSVAITY